MPRKIDSVPTAFSQLKLMLEACRIRKVLIAVTARSFHTVCKNEVDPVRWTIRVLD